MPVAWADGLGPSLDYMTLPTPEGGVSRTVRSELQTWDRHPARLAGVLASTQNPSGQSPSGIRYLGNFGFNPLSTPLTTGEPAARFVGTWPVSLEHGCCFTAGPSPANAPNSELPKNNRSVPRSIYRFNPS